jgi:hypothetical protein
MLDGWEEEIELRRFIAGAAAGAEMSLLGFIAQLSLALLRQRKPSQNARRSRHLTHPTV